MSPAETNEIRHILALAIEPGLGDLDRSLAILVELLGYCGAFAEAEDRVAVIRHETGLLVLFEDETAPVVCGLELCEMLGDVPSLPVRMAVHSGLVHIVGSNAEGSEVDAVQALLEASSVGEMSLSESYADRLREIVGPVGAEGFGAAAGARHQKVVLLDAEGLGLPQAPLRALEQGLSADGYEMDHVESDSRGVDWAKSLEARIRSADTVVAFYSDSAAKNEVLELQLEIAVDERRKRGRPQILPVWRKDRPGMDHPIFALDRNRFHAVWEDSEDVEGLLSEVRAVLALGQTETESEGLELIAEPRDDKYYIFRPSDADLGAALDRHESIVLVKGPSQIGKTSLIDRAREHVVRRGWRCATTDFQRLSSYQIDSESACYRAIAATLAKQLESDFDFEVDWLETLGPNRNIDDFVREMLSASDQPLVWFIDEADRLFASHFASEFYGVVRSWHNARASDPMGPWGRLTVVISYSTEAHLFFIKDLNRSPFNVGYPIELSMFTRANTLDLNEKYGRPISRSEDVIALHDLLGGQPYLTRRAFEILARGEMGVTDLLAVSDRDDGPFRDHLRRILVSVTQLPVVWNALVRSLSSPDLPDSEGLQRLVASGVLVRKPKGGFELRTELYKRYLAKYVAGGFNV